MIRESGDDSFDPDKLAAPLSQGDGYSILQIVLLQQVLTQTALLALRRNDMAMVERKLEELERARDDAMEFHRKFTEALKKESSV